MSARAAAQGVTGFTDATPDLTDDELATLAAAVADGTVMQRLYCMAPVGVAPPPGDEVRLGPVKIMLDDDSLPPRRASGTRYAPADRARVSGRPRPAPVPAGRGSALARR